MTGSVVSACAAQQTNVFSGVSNALRLLDRSGDGPMGLSPQPDGEG